MKESGVCRKRPLLIRPRLSGAVRRSQAAKPPLTAIGPSASSTTAGHAPADQALPAALPKTDDPA
jgi:hypothetical protein